MTGILAFGFKAKNLIFKLLSFPNFDYLDGVRDA